MGDRQMRAQEFVLYRIEDEERGQILKEMSYVMEHFEEEACREACVRQTYHALSKLVEMAQTHGFYGNLWHVYLADYLVNHENAYSLACEIRGAASGSIQSLAYLDCEIMLAYFQYDFRALMDALQVPGLATVFSYTASGEGHVYSADVRDRICTLAQQLSQAQDADALQALLVCFYKEYGVGRFGLHKAFRIEQSGNNADIKPILNIKRVYLDDLVGYEIAKKKLIDNTEAFLAGRVANNCLLFGDAGTGKSTSIKGILNQYYEKGLRIIEVYKHQFQALNDVISQIKNRNYKFIIYMDDLSFEEFETEYKYLKAVIEGGLEKRPDNVLIYATSNRRHLIRETFRDKADRIEDEDMHSNDTVQEKLSLVARFGVTIYYGSPAKKEFDEIVIALAQRAGITMEENELLLKANQWELSHGGRSGRSAQQFIDYLKGQGIYGG